MKELYPLKFKPIYKEKLWGGQKIKTVLGQDFGSAKNCGESWVVSDVPGDVSVVENGALKGLTLNELVAKFGADLLGKNAASETRFPLLVKFLDAAQDLSLQVHPNDTLAQARHGCLGKSEMWYIIQADDQAELISGFAKKTNAQEYLQHLENGKILSLMHHEKVESGDCFFIEAGRVHTIGKGILLAEIQQTSDVTYRIYDFDRTDDKGQKRELHTELALDALDFEAVGSNKVKTKVAAGSSQCLVSCKYFTTNIIAVEKRMICDYSFLDSFVLLTCVKGEAKIKNEAGEASISAGEAVLVPAQAGSVGIWSAGYCEFLETFVPQKLSL
jgi:mannose-6-phosphate isomerase